MSVDSLKQEIAALEAQLSAKRGKLADVRAAIARGDEPMDAHSDTFPVTHTSSGRTVVKGWHGEHLQTARASRGLTKRDLARLCAANGMKSLNVFRLRLYEEEPQAAPTPAEAHLLAQLTQYPPAFFVRPVDPNIRAFGDELRRAIERHSTLIICDVCEQECGDDDSRAHSRCDACKLDLCTMHDHTYEAEVALPHGGTRRVAVAHYCPKCYRRLVSRAHSSKRESKRTQAMLPGYPASQAPAPDIGGLWSANRQ